MCVVVFLLLPSSIFLIYMIHVVLLCDVQSVAATFHQTSGQILICFLKITRKCRPHVMVCLNLVHNKAEEGELLGNDGDVSFSLFWSRDDFRGF